MWTKKSITVTAAAFAAITAVATVTPIATAAITTTTAATATEFTARTTAAAARTAGAGTIFLGTRDVHGQGAIIELGAIQSLDGFLGFLGGGHGYKSESAGTPSHAIHHQIGFENGAMGAERFMEIILRRIEGKISNKQFIAHFDQLSN
jgi:hypothetical protein